MNEHREIKKAIGSAVSKISREVRSSQVVGCIDGYMDKRLRGWAFDRNDATQNLQLVVHVDDAVAGECVADVFRPDLREAGIGSGACGFVFEVPHRFLDGKAHRVQVFEPATRTALSADPVRIEFPLLVLDITGRIEGLDGAWIVGWIRDAARESQPIEFSLEDGAGQELVRGWADQPRSDGSLGFSARLPHALCDGQPHSFTLRVDRPIASIALITPFLTTSPSLLAEFGNAGLVSRLGNSAAARYQALQEQVSALSAGSEARIADAARDLDVAHSALVIGPGKEGRRASYRAFDFPEVAAPVASVLVPVFNKFHYTYHCLASLRLMPNAASFEVIVLDDGSSDETMQLESIVGGVRVVRSGQAFGFLRNCNHGAKEARGEFVVLLNNDTEVSPHWLDHLLKPFATFDDVGLVGAKLVFGDGTLQEAGGIVWRDGSAWNYGRGGNPREPRYNYLRETDYCSGACIALPRAFWEDLGGFDEDFAPAYYEDTDLAFRVRAAGRRVLYQPLCEIVHFEGVSSGTDLKTGVKRFQALNRPKFLNRWSRDFRGNGMPGADPDINKERGYARRVLVIDTEIPQPDRSAGHYAAIQEIRLLQSLGLKPTFLPENMAHLGRYNDDLAEMGVETICWPFYVSPEEFLAQRGHEFELFYITRYHVAANLVDYIRRLCPDGKIILNNADLHFLRMLRMALGETGDADAETDTEDRLEEIMAVRSAELDVMRKVDLVLSYSDAEHAVIQSHNLNRTVVAKCPWVVSTKSEVQPFARRQDIAFLGGFRHTPNLEAVAFFVRDVMPLVRKELPGVRLRVYGSFVPPEIARLGADDIVIEGYVKDINDVFDTCRVFVAPLLSGAGIKGKVLDTLAHGVPAVISPIAAEGIGLRDGLEVAIARTPDEWARKIRHFYHDEAAWTVASKASLDFVAKNYSFARGREAMQDALTQIGIPTLPGLFPH